MPQDRGPRVADRRSRQRVRGDAHPTQPLSARQATITTGIPVAEIHILVTTG